MTGRPLANIDYPWADTERRRLQAVQNETLLWVAENHLAHGSATGAINAAERLIELDPLNEQGWRLAMQAEAILGLRQAIVERYDELSHALAEGLGLSPGTETKELFRRLLSQH